MQLSSAHLEDSYHHHQVLHICGPLDSFEEAQTALLASRFAASTRANSVPTVSYFCRLTREQLPSWRTREIVELVRLAYAVIRQLIEVLPEDRQFNESELGEQAFAAMDGTLGTWEAALTVLECLLREVVEQQPLLHIIIDGICMLDDVSRRSTDKALKELVAVLRAYADRDGGHLVKLLFTTAGESRALNSVLDGRSSSKAVL